MRITTSLLFAAAAISAPSLAQVAAPTHHLVAVVVSGPREMQRLLALELDLASCQPPLLAQRRVEVIATDADLQLLQRGGFRAQVVQRDLESFYAASAANAARQPRGPAGVLSPLLGQGSMGGHFTLAEMEAILDSFHQRFPNLCSAKVSVGTSIENRPLWMVKISDNVNVDENEPEVFYDALHHAREPLSMEATLLFMDELLRGYGTDAEATHIIDDRELYFVPCVNPDGYEYNRATNPGGGGLWRKNRRNNGDGTFGVDINRNYATGWSVPGGSSTATNNETYRGTGPFSEPESQAIEAFVASRQFVLTFSTHTYSEVLLRPWGYQTAAPANAANYDVMGWWLVRETNMPQGSIIGILYPVSGGAVDHHHAAHGAMAWTAELGTTAEGGFWPSGATIDAIARRHQPMFRRAALAAGAALDIVTVTVVEAPGADMDGVVEPGESGLLTVDIQNRGLQAAAPFLLLQATGADATVTIATQQLPSLNAFAFGNTNAQPLAFAVTAAAQHEVRLNLTITGDGNTVVREVVVPVEPVRTFVDDDFELDRGFERGTADTATTGRFERAAPQATVSGTTQVQPGVQTTPGGTLCWVTGAAAGTGAGSFDVDGGFTDLLSPVLDLSHLTRCTASFDLWYFESVFNDAMTVAVSRDGGANWTELYTRNVPTVGYQRIALDLGSPLTSQMQLRVRAQDLNASLVECLVDQLRLDGFGPEGSLTVLSGGRIGSVARLGVVGPSPAFVFLLGAPATGSLTVPGIAGTLLLDPASILELGTLLAGPDGFVAMDVPIPVDAALVGATFHLQAATVSLAGIAFGPNSQHLTIR